MASFFGPSHRCKEFASRLPNSKNNRKIHVLVLALPITLILTACSGGGGSSNGGTATDTTPAAAVVTVFPATATLAASAAMQFSATVQNSSSTVLWQVNSAAGGNSSVGVIDATGRYTAPANVPNPPNVTVTALLLADSSKLGSAAVTIVPPPGPSVAVLPPATSAAVGAIIAFTATVQNSTSPVTWKVNSINGGNTIIRHDTRRAPSPLFTRHRPMSPLPRW